MNEVDICLICGYRVDDGFGDGYMRRHLDSVEHLRMVAQNQEAAKRGFKAWSAIDLDEPDETEEDERLQLRRQLEALQAEDEIPLAIAAIADSAAEQQNDDDHDEQDRKHGRGVPVERAC